MTNYIDGFAFPISREHLSEYRHLSEAVAKIWRQYGALAYHEYVGDDMELDGTRSFTKAVKAQKNEVVVFGWVVFDSREARDLANEKVAADPRMVDLMNSSNSGFNAERMVYGGFQALSSNGNSA